MNGIIDWSLKHRKAVLLMSLVLIGTGGYAISRLSLDAFPDVTDVMVQVNTVAPALSPVEVEQQITAKIEQVMSGIPNLKLVRSMSKFGLSQVTVVFQDGTDIYFARSQVMERLQTLELPAGIERPKMGPISTGLGEIFHYLVTVPNGDLTHARVIQDWLVKPQLLAVPGVAEVNSWGGYEKQFQIVVDPTRLIKHEVTIQEVLEALEHSNLNVGGGNVQSAGEILLVSGKGLLTTTEEIGGITVSAEGGHAVRIRDVADVVEGKAPRLGAVTVEGQDEAVLGLGFMLSGENSHQIADRLRRRFEEVKKTVNEQHPGTRLHVVYERTELVDKVIATVRDNLFEAAILVVAVLFLFLGNMRAAFIVALAIPLSMLFAFNLMLQAGIAGTLMSLGAVDFGMVVDTSVIMVENSVRHLREDKSGRPVAEIVGDACKEVRAPTMFGELIIMIVYLPILMLEGIEGKLFRPMALTIMFALFGSLVLSMTLMPVLASYLLPRRLREENDPWIINLLKGLYRPTVRWVVEHRFTVLGGAVLLLASTVPIAMNLGAIFVPKLNEGSIVLNTVRLPGVSVDESVRYSLRIEELLKKEFPREIRSIWTRTGTPEVATDPMGIEVSDCFIMLTPPEQWEKAKTKEELQQAMNRLLKPLPGLNFSFTQPIEMRFNEMVSGIRTDLGVKIFGDDFDVLRRNGEEVQRILSGIPGASNAFLEPMVGQPVLEVNIDHDALSRYGLHAKDVLVFVESLGAKEVGEVRVGQRTFPLAIRLPDEYVNNPERVRELTIAAPDGKQIPLATLATIERKSGPMVVHREWGRRRAVVTCNIVNRDLGSFVNEVQEKVDAALQKEIKEGRVHRVEYGGQYEHLQRGAQRLMIVVPIALALILFLLYSTYQNIADALRVFTGVPFAAVGGIWALHLRDMPFSIAAGVGFVALCGIAVLDDIVMASTIRQMVDWGMDIKAAVIKASEQRLRAVIMTACLGILGFAPMAFSTGVGAEVQRPLTTVMIGGLFSSTVLTLVLVPAIYVTLKRTKPVKLDKHEPTVLP